MSHRSVVSAEHVRQKVFDTSTSESDDSDIEEKLAADESNMTLPTLDGYSYNKFCKN
jgi:hypothetical protein